MSSKTGLPHWTKAQRERLQEHVDAGHTIAYWNSDQHGYAANGGSRDFRARPGLVQKVEGPLRLCTAYALHATTEPHRWQGCRVWVVAMVGEVKRQGDKCGALERVILGEVLPHEAWCPSVGVRLGRKDLQGAKLLGANLCGVNLYEANLSGANLSGANLSHAYLSVANLYDASLYEANLSYANLSYANLSYANLSYANLYGANLRGADLGDWERGPDGYARRKA